MARPQNGDYTSVTGIQLALQHAFGDTGFRVQLNATLVDGSVELSPADLTQIFALTGLNDSANAIVYDDKGPIEIRAAWNWRDEFLQSLTQVLGDGVTNVDAFNQFDVSVSYTVNDNFHIFVEGINITNELTERFGPFRNHFISAEDTGQCINVGLRFNY